MIFVNLPVKDLARSRGFYGKLGYTFNEQFSDENAICVVISDTIFLTLLVEPFFKTFTKKEIADASGVTEAILAISTDNREAVDELVDKAFAAGASESNDPDDQGFMYSRSFQDPDGHLWEVLWMDPSAVQ
jgi:predicted lactoylglutathione lyase